MDNLILIKNHQATTTSLIVAEKFEKRHDNVIRKIEQIIKNEKSDGFNLLNFEEIKYTDEQGRIQKAYLITKRGFMELALTFTGKKAREWRRKFLDLFEAMEQALLRQSTPDWMQARTESKQARKDLCNVISSFVEYAKSQGSKNADRYYVSITAMINRTLFRIESKLPVNLRDMLNPRQLRHLSTSEDIAINELESGMSRSLPYKEIFMAIKAKITGFAESVGVSAVPYIPAIQA